MASLDKVIDTDFGKREYWSLRNGFTIDVAFSGETCTFFIRDKNDSDFAEIISKYFEAKKFPHVYSGSIDFGCVEIEGSLKDKAIDLVEQAW